MHFAAAGVDMGKIHEYFHVIRDKEVVQFTLSSDEKIARAEQRGRMHIVSRRRNAAMGEAMERKRLAGQIPE